MSRKLSNQPVEGWIRFFLSAILESSQDAIQTIDELTQLRNKNRALIEKLGRARINAGMLFEYLEANPIIDIGKTAEALDLSFNTISAAVKRLQDLGILVQAENASRNRTFVYEEYLEILREGT